MYCFAQILCKMMNAGQDNAMQAHSLMAGCRVYKFLCKCGPGFHIAPISICQNKAGRDTTARYRAGCREPQNFQQQLERSDTLYQFNARVWYLYWLSWRPRAVLLSRAILLRFVSVLTKNLQSLQPEVCRSKFHRIYLLKLYLTLYKLKACHSILYSLVIKKLTEKFVKESVRSVCLNYVV